MKKIVATLEADADGTVHLPLPPELRQGRVKVTATVEQAPEVRDPEAEARRKRAIHEVMEKIRARDPFATISDSVEWQREMREDRPLPGRD